MAEAKTARLVDHGEVRELYADEALFVLRANGAIRISLGALRPRDTVGGIDAHVVGRLVMPEQRARLLAEKLIELLGPSKEGAEATRPPGVSIQ